MMMNYLPKKLNKLRKHYNYSQQYVADKLGIEVIEYMGFENGKAVVNYSQMKKLCNIYHVSMNEMFINSENVELYKTDSDTDEINAKYFMPDNNIKNNIKGFVINHKIITIIIVVLIIAIVVLSIILNNITKPYSINRENINRLSVSDTTVIYIEDSGTVAFSGSNSNGQLNGLVAKDAIKVCEGESFSVVLNKDGNVSSAGLVSKYEKEINSWKNIIDIAAGNDFVLGLDANNKVYCVGENKACEIRGTRDIVKVFANNDSAVCLTTVGTVVYSGNLFGHSYIENKLNIKDIDCSDNITVVLNNDNTVSEYSKEGNYIKAETWTDIVDVTCGKDFIAGLDSIGKVHIIINDNDEIERKVNEWSNIIAIDAGKDYLIAFDGKSIYGVGVNSYNQFIKEDKEKITLEKVKNIDYSLDQNNIYISFDGVNNADNYLIELNVGTGLSKYTDSLETISFLSENMIEGKTYTISITSIGSGDYRDSDVASLDFVYNKPVETIDINISNYKGQNKADLEEYLKNLDITFIGKVDNSVECVENKECVVDINGIEDRKYSKDELSTLLVKYTYCMVNNYD